MATLTLTTDEDYRDGNPVIPANTDSIIFATAEFTRAAFGSDQFGPGLIAHDVAVTGDDENNSLVVILTTASNFSAAAWTFSNWTVNNSFQVPIDRVTLIGTSGADTITGSSQQNFFEGGDGADTLTGGAESDDFFVRPGDVDTGESIDGGAGIDRIAGSGAIDLSGATIANVEILFAPSDATITFAQDQLAASAIGEVDGDTADTQAIIVNGQAIDLSGITFTDWGGANQTIAINGTSASGNTLIGSNQNDIITGGDGADTVVGGDGVDTMSGGGGDDLFVYTTALHLDAESIDGGSGTDTLRLGRDVGAAVYQFNLATLSGIERVEFTDDMDVFFDSSAFAAGGINALLGSGSSVRIVINSATALNLSGVSFASWNGDDTLNLNGSNGNDAITGSSQNDTIRGGNGADTMNGGDGDDVFLYTASDQVTGSEALDGGSGTDILDILGFIGGGTFDFAAAALTSIEALRFTTGGTAALNGNQFGSGGITAVIGSSGSEAIVVDAAATADLSALTFSSWTNGTDTITINGSTGGETLTGSSQNDTINGGAGDDTAVFSGNRSSYTLQVVGNTIVISGLDGTDTLSAIERLQFADGTIDLVNDGSALFDTLFYLDQNPDVFQAGVDPLFHYNVVGFHEGRDPNSFFDTSGYLAVNKDVAASGVNPLEHFHHIGWKQGRDPSAFFDTTLYLINNPDVAAAGIDPLDHFLQSGISEGRAAFAAVGQSIAGGFDAAFYLFDNPDVAAAGVDPFFHYDVAGRFEGRNPNAYFDTAGYLSNYADVAAAGVNPLLHYQVVGWTEGRDPSAGFDTLGYLAANPDVAAAGINPLDHFLQFGIYEGRQAVNDGVFN
jgi:Ca2+-binding RTX toxin-like protein